MAAQAAFARNTEMDALHRCKAWRDLESVLEVGSRGPGAFLEGLVRAFPNKSYTGIDFDPNYIAEALHSKAEGRFSAARAADIRLLDFYDAMPRRFDALTCRLFLQHQPSIEQFCNQAISLCRPGGIIVILKSHDESRQVRPPMRMLDVFFDALRKAQRKAGTNHGSDAARAIFEEQGYRVIESRILKIETRSDAERDSFERTIALAASLTSSLLDLTSIMDAFVQSLPSGGRLKIPMHASERPF